MLTAGILVMVASVVVGLLILTFVAITSSKARSAGRRTRTAMALDSRDEARVERSDAAYAEEPEQPGWLTMLGILSGVGLVLGLLMVMIASIP